MPGKYAATVAKSDCLRSRADAFGTVKRNYTAAEVNPQGLPTDQKARSSNLFGCTKNLVQDEVFLFAHIES